VFFLDVDRFEIINDSLGHTAGDQLLTEITESLVLEGFG
jgi:diguanylate cyclase (GGDEF)-like protein